MVFYRIYVGDMICIYRLFYNTTKRLVIVTVIHSFVESYTSMGEMNRKDCFIICVPSDLILRTSTLVGVFFFKFNIKE